MTMDIDSPIVPLVFPMLVKPILLQLEKNDVPASQILKAAFIKAENANPGLMHDLVTHLVEKSNLDINMNEAMLRLQGSMSENENNNEFRINRGDVFIEEMNRKAISLKRILSRIPDEITDRKAFLETIKEIASAIKKLLDAVNAVSTMMPKSMRKHTLEQRKRDFVKYSKKFSNTLKEYFKEGQADSVFISALFLTHQTNMITNTLRTNSE